MIIAKKDRPVRVKLINMLPTGNEGNLFIPVDTTVMGSGTGYKRDASGNSTYYTQNRVGIHLHGGNTPWISDGSAHQWTAPAGEVTDYPKGVSVQGVPDMGVLTNNDGTLTFYYTNQQSSRLMFYHDHSWGITRLNVYAGVVAGYLLNDPEEELMIDKGVLPNAGGNYRYGIPLIIQDKTFVPPTDQLVKQDPTWNKLFTVGSLWYPHVYMPNQNPNEDSGVNPFGRWDYGPWFWPPYTASSGLMHGPVDENGVLNPGVPDLSLTPEAFMDTPVVNGVPYPYLDVDRKPYRFRILNGCNDRFLNLQLYYAEPLTVSVTDGGWGYIKSPEVIFCGGGLNPNDPKARHAKGEAIIQDGSVIKVNILDPGSGYTSPPSVSFKGGGVNAGGAKAITSINSEVKMIPACPNSKLPPYYPTMDGRDGGVPDPANSGPSFIQIGTEGGFLPAPVVLPNTPIGYDYNRRSITVLNVLEKTLFLAPAERADVIVDFSQVPDNVSHVILYNDAPAPVPAFDPRLDYYTNDPDNTSTGGAPSTLAGYGPNTRTMMQFRLSSVRGEPYDLPALQRELPMVYEATQPPPIVPSDAYPASYHSDYNFYARIQDAILTFKPLNSLNAVTAILQPKAIQELFELDYGRMNAILGTELPFTNAGNQTTVPLNFVDPPTEFIANDEVQLWRITHNGVDTHGIHFHLFNVQIVNRIGWDGSIYPPDPNELGWKETVRMNPLENIVVALKPKEQVLPESFLPLPMNYRILNPAIPLTPPGNTWTSFDPLTGAGVTYTNQIFNMGYEYIWHCHLLGHEENDMMRPIVFDLLPAAPTNVEAYPLNSTSAQVFFNPVPLYQQGQGGAVVSYNVYAVLNSETILPIGPFSGGGSPITVTGLTPGQAYSFYVTAVNAGLPSPGPGLPVTPPGESNPSLLSNVIYTPL